MESRLNYPGLCSGTGRFRLLPALMGVLGFCLVLAREWTYGVALFWDSIYYRGREAQPLLHDKERPALRLAVDASHVLAENADEHELRAAQKQDRDEQRRPQHGLPADPGTPYRTRAASPRNGILHARYPSRSPRSFAPAAGLTRARNSLPVPQRTSHSPTSAKPSGSAIRASTPDRCSAVSSPNRDAA